MRRTLTILAALIVLSTMTIGAAQAACETQHRIFHDRSECLKAKWRNYNPLFGGFWAIGKNWVSAQNTCPDLGTVVAKIDLKAEADRTWHLSGPDKRTTKPNAIISGVYCCSDLGICSREPPAAR